MCIKNIHGVTALQRYNSYAKVLNRKQFNFEIVDNTSQRFALLDIKIYF